MQCEASNRHFGGLRVVQCHKLQHVIDFNKKSAFGTKRGQVGTNNGSFTLNLLLVMPEKKVWCSHTVTFGQLTTTHPPTFEPAPVPTPFKDGSKGRPKESKHNWPEWKKLKF